MREDRGYEQWPRRAKLLNEIPSKYLEYVVGPRRKMPINFARGQSTFETVHPSLALSHRRLLEREREGERRVTGASLLFSSYFMTRSVEVCHEESGSRIELGNEDYSGYGF